MLTQLLPITIRDSLDVIKVFIKKLNNTIKKRKIMIKFTAIMYNNRVRLIFLSL